MGPYLEVQGSCEDPHMVYTIWYRVYGIEYVVHGRYSWRSRVATTRPEL